MLGFFWGGGVALQLHIHIIVFQKYVTKVCKLHEGYWLENLWVRSPSSLFKNKCGFNFTIQRPWTTPSYVTVGTLGIPIKQNSCVVGACYFTQCWKKQQFRRQCYAGYALVIHCRSERHAKSALAPHLCRDPHSPPIWDMPHWSESMILNISTVVLPGTCLW